MRQLTLGSKVKTSAYLFMATEAKPPKVEALPILDQGVLVLNFASCCTTEDDAGLYM